MVLIAVMMGMDLKRLSTYICGLIHVAMVSTQYCEIINNIYYCYISVGKVNTGHIIWVCFTCFGKWNVMFQTLRDAGHAVITYNFIGFINLFTNTIYIFMHSALNCNEYDTIYSICTVDVTMLYYWLLVGP